jgi:hypothetical protein
MLRDIPVLAADLPLVAGANQSEGVGNIRHLLVQEIFPRVGNLGMNGLDQAELVRPLAMASLASYLANTREFSRAGTIERVEPLWT